MDLLRGEVWDAQVRGAGTCPFVILTVNPMIGRLSAVTAAIVTGTAGPPHTHIPIGPDAGVTAYPESYVNATDVHTIPKARFHRRRGRLAAADLASVERAVRVYLGL